MPCSYPHSLYSTPFFGFFLYFKPVLGIGRSLFRAVLRRGKFRDVIRDYKPPIEGGWLTLDYAILEVEKLAEARSSSRTSTLVVGALSWSLNSLSEDQDLEK
jgi:hypothetical protein